MVVGFWNEVCVKGLNRHVTWLYIKHCLYKSGGNCAIYSASLCFKDGFPFSAFIVSAVFLLLEQEPSNCGLIQALHEDMLISNKKERHSFDIYWPKQCSSSSKWKVEQKETSRFSRSDSLESTVVLRCQGCATRQVPYQERRTQ